jgi:hypothetical protein
MVMQRFIFFFRGASALDDQAANKQLWDNWIEKLKSQNALIDHGFLTDGKIVSDNGKKIVDFHFNVEENANGFAIVQANTMEDAIILTEGCPIFKRDGNITIRPITD